MTHMQKYYGDNFFDEKTELERLGNMMVHTKKFFEAHKIPNLWFQTFNTYRFPSKNRPPSTKRLTDSYPHPSIRDFSSIRLDIR